jgi:rubrerythrin
MTAKGTVLSLPDAVAQVLEEHLGRRRGGDEIEIKEEVLVVAPKQVAAGTKQIADFGYMPECPDCGASLIMAEGCINCPSCGYNRCM